MEDTKALRFQWKRHPLVEGGARCWLAGSGIVALCWLAALSIGEAPYAFLVIAAFLHSLKEFLFPHTYELSDDGVAVSSITGPRSEPWSAFRGMRRTPAGLLLTRTAHPGP